MNASQNSSLGYLRDRIYLVQTHECIQINMYVTKFVLHRNVLVNVIIVIWIIIKNNEVNWCTHAGKVVDVIPSRINFIQNHRSIDNKGLPKILTSNSSSDVLKMNIVTDLYANHMRMHVG
jgi:hypothetical protein